MSKKVAFLVTACVTSRVVLDMDDDYVEYETPLTDVVWYRAGEVAKRGLVENLENSVHDCTSEIIEDGECPYGTFENEK